MFAHRTLTEGGNRRENESQRVCHGWNLLPSVSNRPQLSSRATAIYWTDQILDRAGKLRVIFRTPNWEDFVHLAFTEIRFYGAENIQIARRLRAMIVNLTDTLPEQHHSALRKGVKSSSFWIARSRSSIFYPRILVAPESLTRRALVNLLTLKSRVRVILILRASKATYIETTGQALLFSY